MKSTPIKKSNLDSDVDLAALIKSEKHHKLAVQQAKVAFWRWDLVEDKLTDWSDEYAKIDASSPGKTHSSDDELRVVHVDDRSRVKEIYDEVYKNPRTYGFDFRIVDPNGDVRWLHEHGEVEYDDNGKPAALFGILQDITNRKELEQRLVSLSRTDDLTGLINRREFDVQLEHALARSLRASSRIALLFIDMDGFKKVNDDFGHDAGDQVLKMIAERVTMNIRKTDLAGRMGGDEFTVLLESDITEESLIPVVERILQSLSEPFKLPKNKIAQLSGSIGIALSPDHANDIKKLYSISDIAMYEAKKLGKNQFVMGHN